MIYTGTSHFTSKTAADRYYRELGYPNADVALAEGAISIGPPSIASGETLSVIPDEQRYQIGRPRQYDCKPTTNLQDEIGHLTHEEGKILLPKVRLQLYGQIKSLIETSGGRYNSKGYFTFPDGVDVAEVLSALRTGKPVNGKKESQSFFTPEDLAYQVCRKAGYLEGRRVLEPSAGHGALADIAEAAGAEVIVVENYVPNILRLREKGYDVIEKDFLALSVDDIGLFDVVIANPPFSRNQDIDHILHMWTFLKPGGVLSAIASRSWMTGKQQKQQQFTTFLQENNADIEEIDAGAFRESGTNVSTVHIQIRKQEQYDEIMANCPTSTRFERDQMNLAF